MPTMYSPALFAVLAFFSTPSNSQEGETASATQDMEAQAEADAVERNPIPIVVLGNEEERKAVVVGSRIPRTPLFDSKTHVVASSTGTPGLTPGSGMDPGASVRSVSKSTCKASDSQVSSNVACALIAAKDAMANEDWDLVRGILIPLAANDSLSPFEQKAVADYLYISASVSEDLANQVEALEILLGTDALSQGEAGKAWRSLSTLYLRSGRKDLAISALDEAVRVNPNDGRALHNLNILREQDD